MSDAGGVLIVQIDIFENAGSGGVRDWVVYAWERRVVIGDSFCE